MHKSASRNTRRVLLWRSTRLSFNKNVDNVCPACYFNIRVLRHVRSSMSRETADMVACAIVSSRPDYCSCALANMSNANLDRLQGIQNTLLHMSPRNTATRPRHSCSRRIALTRASMDNIQSREVGLQDPWDSTADVSIGTSRSLKPSHTLRSSSVNLLAV